jgi:type I restriction enzyme M protein
MNADTIISRVWSFSTVLRDDGVPYGDYLEQLTYLIFLKMSDEYSKSPYNRDLKIPARYLLKHKIRYRTRQSFIELCI